MTNTPPLPSLDGLRFAASAPTEGGEVGPETIFEYHESDAEIWASYAGGDVRRGFLVGTRHGDTLHFRYSQLSADGETSTGRCTSVIVRGDDGRLTLEETWAWESRPGSGTSAVHELHDAPEARR
ncbi:hypothetical protein [Microbacterium sp. NIBRBAC000506063]|uniref:hypothetical protein n=1 Tax=Microbacterium sp. NIBRBAC000506063 TaxID=2734618 RepID=UPI001BB7F0CF|nr:hypothetical protein [Microbacterium sp. NIBRBAC000506063]QTV79739.1 hypothetical protein KAE78_13525 [Microbacterium sp. NIBRBAC000506063]